MKIDLPSGCFILENEAAIGEEIHGFAAELYPICRSITGEGLRKTLGKIGNRIPLSIREVPTGTEVFDWNVPKEWNIRSAYIKSPDGKTVVDFKDCNLHVVNYSVPVRAKMPLEVLRQHLHTIPKHPDWIPYRTTYYKEDWGFCLTHNQFLAMQEGEYEVVIDSTLASGSLSYGECFLPGSTDKEIIISAHACHPSLANDNLSGLTVATYLARFLSQQKLNYSYRFLFMPGTIGAITWLAHNRENASRIHHGLVLTCIGDSGGFHYKKSRRGDAEIDRAVACVLRHCGDPFDVMEFSPYGYDERQFCSPGFNLPVGCLMRSVWGSFEEYHTSADDLSFIQPQALARSLSVCLGVVEVLENNRTYANQSPYCEPQLGKRNLYRSTGGVSVGSEIDARLWVLNLSDGEHSLLDIAERSGIAFSEIGKAASVLRDAGLLRQAKSTQEN